MHRQTFIFLLAHQTSSINRKINHKNNHNKQSKISQSKTRPKQPQQTTHTISQSKTHPKQTVKTNTTNYLTNRKINHTNNHD